MEPPFLMHIDQPQFTTACLGLLISLLIVATLRKYTKRPSLPLPPSPKSYPIIGNLFDLPPSGVRAADWWSRHKSLYGPISSVSIFGLTMIIVNDRNIAFELLDRGSSVCSSRPPLTMAKLSNCHRATPILEYGPELRAHRREFQQYIGTPAAMARFAPMEEIEMRRLLLRILEEPDKVTDHIRRTTGAIILKIAYGYNPNLRGNDTLVDLAETAMVVFSNLFDGGAWMVDVFPALRHLPAWLPGMAFKRKAKVWREEMQKFTDLPYKLVQQKLANGTATPSFAAKMIERNDIDEERKKWISATLYAGGTDTSVSTFLTFFLAMVLYPDVQRRAQKELDEVVGRDRIPSISDKASGRLRYIEAVVKETLRWNSVAPMGAPHVCTEETKYGGYRIPKGSLVMANIWQTTHDPEIHDDPYSFKPERFLGPDAELESGQYSFGFGRRICPGRELALQSVFLAISMVLSTFDISKARDENGNEIIPKCEFTVGGNSQPKPFAYSVRPRDERAIALIRSVMDEYPIDRGDTDELKALADLDN